MNHEKFHFQNLNELKILNSRKVSFYFLYTNCVIVEFWLALKWLCQSLWLRTCLRDSRKFWMEEKKNSVVAHGYWRFPRWSVIIYAMKLDFVLRQHARCGRHDVWLEKIMTCGVERFVFCMFVGFIFGQCVIRCVLLSVCFRVWEFFTGRHDYEHVQANRMHVGLENNTFWPTLFLVWHA